MNTPSSSAGMSALLPIEVQGGPDRDQRQGGATHRRAIGHRERRHALWFDVRSSDFSPQVRA